MGGFTVVAPPATTLTGRGRTPGDLSTRRRSRPAERSLDSCLWRVRAPPRRSCSLDRQRSTRHRWNRPTPARPVRLQRLVLVGALFRGNNWFGGLHLAPEGQPVGQAGCSGLGDLDELQSHAMTAGPKPSKPPQSLPTTCVDGRQSLTNRWRPHHSIATRPLSTSGSTLPCLYSVR